MRRWPAAAALLCATVLAGIVALPVAAQHPGGVVPEVASRGEVGSGCFPELSGWVPAIGIRPAVGPGARTDPVETGPPFQWSLLGGQSGLSGGVHRYGGVHASMSGRRWGGGVQLHRGTGNGFSSTFAMAGPSARFGVHPRAEVHVMAGPAYYGESLESSGRSGSVIGPAGSVLLRSPAGPVHLVAGVTGWYASYTDDIAVNPVPARGVRLFLGVGR